MRKFLLIIVALFIANSAFSQTKYKYWNFGVKAGVNFSSLSDEEDAATGINFDVEDPSSIKGRSSWTVFKDAGFHVGTFANISMGNIFSFQPEILLSMQRGNRKENLYKIGGNEIAGVADHDYQLCYIQFPLLFEIEPVANLGILAGIQLSFNVSRNSNYTYLGISDQNLDPDPDIDPNTSLDSVSTFYYTSGNGFRKRDASLVIGLQYMFIKHITVSARYNMGLLNNLDYSSSGKVEDNSNGWKNNVVQLSLGYLF